MRGIAEAWHSFGGLTLALQHCPAAGGIELAVAMTLSHVNGEEGPEKQNTIFFSYLK